MCAFTSRAGEVGYTSKFVHQWFSNLGIIWGGHYRCRFQTEWIKKMWGVCVSVCVCVCRNITQPLKRMK